jgi:outer membrane lipoprotein-sorting protein
MTTNKRTPRLRQSRAGLRFGRITTALLLIVVSVAAIGCRPPTEPAMPTYAWTNDADAIRRIDERASAVRTVSSTCLITLTRPDGQSVALDGILLSEKPDRLRLQASKFGQKLFDLTLNADGLFVRIDDPSRKDKVVPASLSAGRFAQEWQMFQGGFFRLPGLSVDGSGPKQFTARAQLSDGRRVVCDIDRDTLLPRRYRMFDPQNVERFTLSIPRYRLINGVPYPDLMVALSDQGTIQISQREVELNVELPPAAFKAPRGAEKVGVEPTSQPASQPVR